MRLHTVYVYRSPHAQFARGLLLCHVHGCCRLPRLPLHLSGLHIHLAVTPLRTVTCRCTRLLLYTYVGFYRVVWLLVTHFYPLPRTRLPRCTHGWLFTHPIHIGLLVAVVYPVYTFSFTRLDTPFTFSSLRVLYCSCTRVPLPHGSLYVLTALFCRRGYHTVLPTTFCGSLVAAHTRVPSRLPPGLRLLRSRLRTAVYGSGLRLLPTSSTVLYCHLPVTVYTVLYHVLPSFSCRRLHIPQVAVLVLTHCHAGYVGLRSPHTHGYAAVAVLLPRLLRAHTVHRGYCGYAHVHSDLRLRAVTRTPPLPRYTCRCLRLRGLRYVLHAATRFIHYVRSPFWFITHTHVREHLGYARFRCTFAAPFTRHTCSSVLPYTRGCTACGYLYGYHGYTRFCHVRILYMPFIHTFCRLHYTWVLTTLHGYAPRTRCCYVARCYWLRCYTQVGLHLRYRIFAVYGCGSLPVVRSAVAATLHAHGLLPRLPARIRYTQHRVRLPTTLWITFTVTQFTYGSVLPLPHAVTFTHAHRTHGYHRSLRTRTFGYAFTRTRLVRTTFCGYLTGYAPAYVHLLVGSAVTDTFCLVVLYCLHYGCRSSTFCCYVHALCCTTLQFTPLVRGSPLPPPPRLMPYPVRAFWILPFMVRHGSVTYTRSHYVRPAVAVLRLRFTTTVPALPPAVACVLSPLRSRFAVLRFGYAHVHRTHHHLVLVGYRYCAPLLLFRFFYLAGYVLRLPAVRFGSAPYLYCRTPHFMHVRGLLPFYGSHFTHAFTVTHRRLPAIPLLRTAFFAFGWLRVLQPHAHLTGWVTPRYVTTVAHCSCTVLVPTYLACLFTAHCCVTVCVPVTPYGLPATCLRYHVPRLHTTYITLPRCVTPRCGYAFVPRLHYLAVGYVLARSFCGYGSCLVGYGFRCTAFWLRLQLVTHVPVPRYTPLVGLILILFGSRCLGYTLRLRLRGLRFAVWLSVPLRYVRVAVYLRLVWFAYVVILVLRTVYTFARSLPFTAVGLHARARLLRALPLPFTARLRVPCCVLRFGSFVAFPFDFAVHHTIAFPTTTVHYRSYYLHYAVQFAARLHTPLPTYVLYIWLPFTCHHGLQFTPLVGCICWFAHYVAFTVHGCWFVTRPRILHHYAPPRLVYRVYHACAPRRVYLRLHTGSVTTHTRGYHAVTCYTLPRTMVTRGCGFVRGSACTWLFPRRFFCVRFGSRFAAFCAVLHVQFYYTGHYGSLLRTRAPATVTAHALLRRLFCPPTDYHGYYLYSSAVHARLVTIRFYRGSRLRSRYAHRGCACTLRTFTHRSHAYPLVGYHARLRPDSTPLPHSCRLYATHVLPAAVPIFTYLRTLPVVTDSALPRFYRCYVLVVRLLGSAVYLQFGWIITTYLTRLPFYGFLRIRLPFAFAPVGLRLPHAVAVTRSHAHVYRGWITLQLPVTTHTTPHRLRLLLPVVHCDFVWIWLRSRFTPRTFFAYVAIRTRYHLFICVAVVGYVLADFTVGYYLHFGYGSLWLHAVLRARWVATLPVHGLDFTPRTTTYALPAGYGYTCYHWFCVCACRALRLRFATWFVLQHTVAAVATLPLDCRFAHTRGSVHRYRLLHLPVRLLPVAHGCSHTRTGYSALLPYAPVAVLPHYHVTWRVTYHGLRRCVLCYRTRFAVRATRCRGSGSPLLPDFGAGSRTPLPCAVPAAHIPRCRCGYALPVACSFGSACLCLQFTTVAVPGYGCYVTRDTTHGLR